MTKDNLKEHSHTHLHLHKHNNEYIGKLSVYQVDCFQGSSHKELNKNNKKCARFSLWRNAIFFVCIVGIFAQ